jgi:hypothetical protein
MSIYFTRTDVRLQDRYRINLGRCLFPFYIVHVRMSMNHKNPKNLPETLTLLVTFLV